MGNDVIYSACHIANNAQTEGDCIKRHGVMNRRRHNYKYGHTAGLTHARGGPGRVQSSARAEGEKNLTPAAATRSVNISFSHTLTARSRWPDSLTCAEG